MLFISLDDFLNTVKTISPLTREEVLLLASQMHDGDEEVRDKLVRGYLPFVATFIRRAPRSIQTLSTVYACIDCLKKSLDRFNFAQDRKPFANYLGRRLRLCIVRCLINRS